MKSELSKIMVGAHYEIECLDKDGNLKWKEDFDNLVPDGCGGWVIMTYRVKKRDYFP